MRLTTKARHAINAMIDLAIRQQHGPVRLADMAERENISQSYLELLFGKLRRGRLVAGVRGPGGGYRLGKPTTAISMADIVEAVDETGLEADGAPPPAAERSGPTDALWAGLAATVREHLKSVTIADMLESVEAATAPAALEIRLPTPMAAAIARMAPAAFGAPQAAPAMHP